MNNVEIVYVGDSVDLTGLNLAGVSKSYTQLDESVREELINGKYLVIVSENVSSEKEAELDIIREKNTVFVIPNDLSQSRVGEIISKTVGIKVN